VNDDREDSLQQYLDGHLDPDQCRDFEQELLADESLMADAYDEITIREALSERARVRRKRRRPGTAVWVSLAAAASLAFFAVIQFRPEADPVYRGEADLAPTAVSPVGRVAEIPDRFVWTRDPGAASYRLEIFDQEGSRRLVATSPDTFYTLEGGLVLPPAGSWRATTIDSVGIGVRSTGLVPFEFP